MNSDRPPRAPAPSRNINIEEKIVKERLLDMLDGLRQSAGNLASHRPRGPIWQLAVPMGLA